MSNGVDRELHAANYKILIYFVQKFTDDTQSSKLLEKGHYGSGAKYRRESIQ